MSSMRLQLKVNNADYILHSQPMRRLLDILREDLNLTGTKEGCGEGECGACAVLLDGELVNSCLVPAVQADGAEITTIEGVAAGNELHPIQQAFILCGGTQCGMCTPGMIMAVTSLLRRDAAPSPEEIARSLVGNLCRCTGYTRIFESVIQASHGLQGVEP